MNETETIIQLIERVKASEREIEKLKSIIKNCVCKDCESFLTCQRRFSE
ncbi:MAG: hypothetical protein HXS54_01500 [Theionarchaea archaeon]|nr:hypothetical protein [Theionarchaea archaeon]